MSALLILHVTSFSKPSVSVAMKNLKTSNYITVDENGFINLTEAGQEIADKIYERHTFLTNWLTSLGVDPEVAAEDACKWSMPSARKAFLLSRNLWQIPIDFTGLSNLALIPKEKKS